VLILETLDQSTFDAMPPIGDFRVLFMGAGACCRQQRFDREMTVRLDASDTAPFEKYRSLSLHLPLLGLRRVEAGQARAQVQHVPADQRLFQDLPEAEDLGPLILSAGADQGSGEGDPGRRRPGAPPGQEPEARRTAEGAPGPEEKRQPGGVLPISSLVRFMLGLFGFFIIVSFFIGLRMVRVITRAVNELTKGTEKIRRGDFSYRIRIKSREQMHFLAESFNDMASGIGRLLTEEKEKQRLEEAAHRARHPAAAAASRPFRLPRVRHRRGQHPGHRDRRRLFRLLPSPGRFLSVLVADVSGKGAQAAFYMAELKGIMNCLQKSGKEPAAILNECNLSLQNSFEKVTFMTINLVRFDLQAKNMIFSRSSPPQPCSTAAKRRVPRAFAARHGPGAE
jgi:hypothetical protein